LAAETLGDWRPLTPEQAHERLRALTSPWWIAGGHAIDLFLGVRTRAHTDLDVGLFRDGQAEIFSALHGWEIHAAVNGRLRLLAAGETLRRGEHGLWCRPGAALPWALELMVNERDGADWVYRRDPEVRRPLDHVVLHDSRGIPYLAPEVQLLFKSKGRRPRDEQDLDVVLPRLDAGRREWLRAQLRRADPAHPWLRRLG